VLARGVTAEAIAEETSEQYLADGHEGGPVTGTAAD
jgi:hypothetical protein